MKITALSLTMLITTSLIPHLSHAGGAGVVGNGGGAWACLTDGKVKVFLVDLFEGRTEYYLEIPDFSDLAEVQLQEAMKRIQESNPKFHDLLLPYVGKVLRDWPAQGNSRLEIVGDSNYTRIPGPQQCAGPAFYVQIVNFTWDGRILIDYDYYSALSETDRAALFLHEAIYWLLRVEERATTSLRTKKLVAHVFSTLEPHTYKNLLVVNPNVVTIPIIKDDPYSSINLTAEMYGDYSPADIDGPRWYEGCIFRVQVFGELRGDFEGPRKVQALYLTPSPDPRSANGYSLTFTVAKPCPGNYCWVPDRNCIIFTNSISENQPPFGDSFYLRCPGVRDRHFSKY